VAAERHAGQRGEADRGAERKMLAASALLPMSQEFSHFLPFSSSVAARSMLLVRCRLKTPAAAAADAAECMRAAHFAAPPPPVPGAAHAREPPAHSCSPTATRFPPCHAMHAAFICCCTPGSHQPTRAALPPRADAAARRQRAFIVVSGRAVQSAAAAAARTPNGYGYVAAMRRAEAQQQRGEKIRGDTFSLL